MSQSEAEPYEFGDDLPISGIEPGTNLLVSGPTMAGTRDLAFRLVTDGNDRNEGMVIITTNKGGEKVLSECEGFCGDFELSQFGIVDCVSKQHGRDRFSERIETVSSPGDLTGVGIKFSGLYETIHRTGSERVRVGLYSLSTLLMYSDFQTVSRFVHTVSGRIAATGGLGVFLIDPSTQDERVVSTMTQLCDGRIDVREHDGNREFRVRGLSDHSRKWMEF
jgi:KaiC/GvpD/RAD55 family RecA-like ATPase